MVMVILRWCHQLLTLRWHIDSVNGTEEIIPSISGVGPPRGGGAFYQELD
jgi:hypothetical protein